MSGPRSGIDYVVGDATRPRGDGHKIITHVNNDVGGWGRGFVLALSQRWSEPEAAYRQWYAERGLVDDFCLGRVRLVQVEHDTWVANMIGQRDLVSGPSGPPVRYDAIEEALRAVADEANQMNASVHMPRIGCGLAGGDWPTVEAIIERTLCAAGVAVTVYDLDEFRRG